ncbi:retropepsin-like aspartic protease [Sphingobacterium sp. SYP-B4668]|uniref:retropepsin-like aspartic protease n=1 Tax=Sphingobacterium sp. SYP-B4668 TaxID=2996035 RepID=UPI0022DDF826|nr:retropepsin-like aspartic protease [Sphingobacterium sp. SYP-B4668]
MTIIPFTLLNLQGDGYHIIIDVEIFDTPFKMVLDTGASKTVLDKTTVMASGLAEHDLQSTNILSTGLGTNSMESFTLHLPKIKIQDWQTKKIDVAVLDLSAINYAYGQMELPLVIGVLGGDILTRYGAVIDYNKCTIKLRSRPVRRS